MLCLDHIRKFTDPDDYELIVIDPYPVHQITDGYKTLRLEEDENTTWVKEFPDGKDPGYTGGMNYGAGIAKYDILVFIQNDVFVREDWLGDLKYYIEKENYDCVFPDQVPRSREYVIKSYDLPPYVDDAKKGGRDAGLMMVTKKSFKEIGGWNKDLGLLAERDFYERYKGKWTDTNRVLITHIMAGTNVALLDSDPDEYNRRMDNDAKKLNKE